MTKTDLFKIILKLFGLYSVIGIIIQIPVIIYTLEFNDEFTWMLLLSPLIGIYIIYILLFSPMMIINLFKLNQGFENQEVAHNSFEGKTIIKIALIAVSIYLIIENLGVFITQLLFSFKENISSSLESLISLVNPYAVNYTLMFSSGINLAVGFLILTNYIRLSNWIEKLNHKNV